MCTSMFFFPVDIGSEQRRDARQQRTQLVVVLGREQAGAQLREHVGTVLEGVHELAVVLR